MAQFDELVDAFREKAETVIHNARESGAALDAFQKELKDISKQVTAARKEIGKQAAGTRKPRTTKVQVQQPERMVA